MNFALKKSCNPFYYTEHLSLTRGQFYIKKNLNQTVEVFFICSSDLFHNTGKNDGKDAANAGCFLFAVESVGIFAKNDVFVSHPTVNIGLGLAVIIFHGSKIEHNEHSFLSLS